MRHVTEIRLLRVRARMTWLWLGLAVLAWPAGAWAATFNYTNSSAITIPAVNSGDTSGAPATPYPSSITVSGFIGTPISVKVTLTGLSHTFPDDIDILLVGPRVSPVNKITLMSDAGGSNDISGVTLVFDLAAVSTLPDDGLIASGTYLPSNFGTPDPNSDLFPAPAPPGPFTGLLSDLFGRDPNGNWSLYIVDDASIDIGSLSGGWTLTLVTADTTDDQPPPPSVPEPATAHLLLSGLALLGGLSWRRARRK